MRSALTEKIRLALLPLIVVSRWPAPVIVVVFGIDNAPAVSTYEPCGTVIVFVASGPLPAAVTAARSVHSKVRTGGQAPAAVSGARDREGLGRGRPRCEQDGENGKGYGDQAAHPGGADPNRGR